MSEYREADRCPIFAVFIRVDPPRLSPWLPKDPALITQRLLSRLSVSSVPCSVTTPDGNLAGQKKMLGRRLPHPSLTDDTLVEHDPFGDIHAILVQINDQFLTLSPELTSRRTQWNNHHSVCGPATCIRLRTDLLRRSSCRLSAVATIRLSSRGWL